MPSFGVVLDANVLFSAPLRDTLLRAADRGLYRLHWTGEILEEVRRNLVETGRAKPDKAQHLVETMQAYFPDASVTGYESLVPVMVNHPKDRHVLAAAVVSKSQVIVTHNLRDFPEEALAPFNIQAQAPDHFLTDLFDFAPEVLTQIVLEQASDLHKPPQTVDRVLTKLEQHAPRFAHLVRLQVLDLLISPQAPEETTEERK